MATHAVPGTGLELILNAAEGVLQIVVTEDEAILCAQEWYLSLIHISEPTRPY